MQHMVLRGTAFARGYQLGKQLGGEHAAFTAPGSAKLQARAATHWPPYRLEAVRGNMLLATEQFAPSLLEQMRGMATGANLPFATLVNRELAASIGLAGPGNVAGASADRTATSLVSAGSCTNIGAITADAGPVLAKTDDGSPSNADAPSPYTLLEEWPDDGLPSLIVGKYGQLKVELGLNAAGVAIGQSSQSTQPGADGLGVPEFLLARVALTRCRTTAEAVQFLVKTPSAGKG